MKLDKLILVNWGALRSQEYPMGSMTLLTGPTGSGKSTMLDALQTVMTAVYQNIFNYNPGQDETTQGARNGKTKRTLWSYIVGAEDNLYARPDGAHGYIGAVFQPSEGEEGCGFTALIAASARVDSSGARRQATGERLGLYLIDNAALTLDDLTATDEDGSLLVVPVERIEAHLSARYREVTGFRDSKREYLCQLYGRFRGLKAVSFAEAESAARAWSLSIAHRPIGSVDELVRKHILELDATALSQRIAQISRLMRQVNALRREGERMSAHVGLLERLGRAAGEAAEAHEAAASAQWLASLLALREDRRQADRAAEAIAQLKASIAAENDTMARLEEERHARGRSLTQVHAQMMGIPAVEQQRRIREQLEDSEARARAALTQLRQAAGIAQRVIVASRDVAAMRFPAHQLELTRAAATVGASLSALDANAALAQFDTIERLAALKETDVLQSLLLVRELDVIEAPLTQLHAALAGGSDSVVAALHAGIARLRGMEDGAQKRERDAAARRAHLAEGGADYPGHVRQALKEFRAELPDAGAQVLCDLVEPVSGEWQAAIEGYLGGARFSLVVASEWEARAIALVRQKRLRISVIQGSLCMKQAKPERTPAESIVHELASEHPVALAYLHEQYGQVVKVADAEALRHALRGLTRDGKGSGSRTMFAAEAEQLVFGQESRRQARERAESEHAAAEEELVALRAELRELQGALALIAQLPCPSFATRDALERATRELDAARSDFNRLDLSAAGKLQAEADALGEEIARIEERKAACNKAIGGFERSLQNQEAALARIAAALPARQEAVDADAARFKALCATNASLSFVAAAEAIATRAETGKASAQEVQDDIARQRSRCWQVYSNVRDALGAYHAQARSEERFDGGADLDSRDGDFGPLHARMITLRDRTREQLLRQRDIGLVKNLDQLRMAESSFNDVFTRQFCYEIRNGVDAGVRTLKALNMELERLRFGTDRFRIDWSEWVPEYRAYYDFFCAAAELPDAQDNLFGAQDLSQAQRVVRDRLVALLLSDDEEAALRELQRVADFRNYRRYEIYKESDTGSRLRLSEWGTGSGGQLETPAYIIHAAVVTNKLKHFEKGPSLKLLVNDESFSKMDETRARDVLKFLRESLGMQLICAMPTKHAGAIKPEFSREWSFSRTVAEGNGEVGFLSEADERVLRSDRLRELWEMRRWEVREQVRMEFGDGGLEAA
ncbi:AAA family ATPase [Noviherbaspirillum sp. DKR-6]|uniref:AAA family ATPase n=1 Tax=Noviherbaspirillum pedocola TaxID=2801341 RepID=A0A934SQN3_9BURK|nr:SbcC/MukB-like Walker B domain-containing protein [Noviherbaspirillum pedocola]MBK4733341.1 AAA family ATPase [Noviherbaspirillum pedocola]